MALKRQQSLRGRGQRHGGRRNAENSERQNSLVATQIGAGRSQRQSVSNGSFRPPRRVKRRNARAAMRRQAFDSRAARRGKNSGPPIGNRARSLAHISRHLAPDIMACLSDARPLGGGAGADVSAVARSIFVAPERLGGQA